MTACSHCDSPLIRRADGLTWCATCTLSALYDRHAADIALVEPPADLVDRVMAEILRTATAQHDRVLLTKWGIEP